MRNFSLFSLLATVACWSGPVEAGPLAEVICAPSSQLEARLAKQYGTEKSALGMQGPDQLMEVWTDRQGDWAMVVRYASGTSCIVAMGEHWQTLQGDTS